MKNTTRIYNVTNIHACNMIMTKKHNITKVNNMMTMNKNNKNN